MKSPFSVNFETLQQYDFLKTTFDEVLFYEWLVTRTKILRVDKFYYQQEKIMFETGLKRRRLETLKSSFIKRFHLKVEHGGQNNTTFYTVSEVFVRNFILANVKEDMRDQVLLKVLS